jgi:hypothetical protein
VKTLILVITLVCCSSPALALWQETSRSAEQTTILNKVETLVQANKRPVVIFDLDSTLFDARPRWAAIIREFGQVKGLAKLTKATADQMIDNFSLAPNLASVLKAKPEDITELTALFKEFWAERFFSSEFVKFDRPLPGAVAYVNALKGKGAAIVYITSRVDKTMRDGTEFALTKAGYPFGDKKTLLLMKKTDAITLGKKYKSDVGYKKILVVHDRRAKEKNLKKARALGTVVASFENEPGHINTYYDAFHKDGTGLAVFLDTDRTPKRNISLKDGVVAVRGFLR